MTEAWGAYWILLIVSPLPFLLLLLILFPIFRILRQLQHFDLTSEFGYLAQVGYRLNQSAPILKSCQLTRVKTCPAVSWL
jgi:hypothetical protein